MCKWFVKCKWVWVCVCYVVYIYVDILCVYILKWCDLLGMYVEYYICVIWAHSFRQSIHRVEWNSDIMNCMCDKCKTLEWRFWQNACRDGRSLQKVYTKIATVIQWQWQNCTFTFCECVCAPDSTESFTLIFFFFFLHIPQKIVDERSEKKLWKKHKLLEIIIAVYCVHDSEYTHTLLLHFN